MRTLKVFALAMLGVVMVAGSAAAQAPPAPSASEASAPPAAATSSAPAPSAGLETFPAVDSAYTLGPGDVIEVAVVGRSEYNTRARVSVDGVLLPLIGSVPAVNVRPSELAVHVAAKLDAGGFYSKPVVRIEVVTVASRFATVFGQVGSPGLVPLDRVYRISEILARVGAKFGDGSARVIMTRANGTQEKLLMGDIAIGVANSDPVVSPGDKIYVPAAESQVVYVNGAVRSPGTYPITAGLTVRTALARAGGVTENGSEKKFSLLRKGVKVPRAKLETPLEVDDIVKFGEKMF